MRWEDALYVGATTLVGGGARAMRRGLPPGWRLRLEAVPPEELTPGWIWLHAVSVGELLLAEGVLGWLRDQGHRIHVTTGTPAGLDLLRKRLVLWNQGTGRVSGGAFPWDDPEGLRPFLQAGPRGCVILETELWPYLLKRLDEAGIPALIVNGRLTEKSLGKGARWLRMAAGRLTCVAARDELSMEAFRQLGARDVRLGGNLKADLPPPSPLHDGWEPLRKAWAGDPVLVVGNTVEGEEALLLDAWSRVRRVHPGAKLILAPRQPRRFQEVAQLFKALGLRFHRASGAWPGGEGAWKEADALLLDTLGELPSAYREGTIALVAGGWSSDKGHNPLEPARWGVPTLVGPGFRNFEDLVHPLLAAGRLSVVEIPALEETLLALLAKVPLRPGQAEVELPCALRGALGRTCAILKDIIPSPR